MNAPRQQMIRTPAPQRVEDFKRRQLPIIVWALSALIVVAMLVGRAREFEYIGLAQSAEYEISADATGKIETVLVELYEDVDPGDVLAKLDDAELLASIATANSAIGRLQAELHATQAELSSASGQEMAAWVNDLRRFQINEEQRLLEILALKVEIESDAVELEQLHLEYDRNRPLVDSGYISQSMFDNIRLTRDRVDKRLADNRILLEQTEQEYRVAVERRESYERELPEPPRMEPMLLPLHAGIEEESRRLDQIELRREAMTLRSPVVGQVSQILCRRGQAVVPGEPILIVAERSVKEIIAYLEEPEGLDVKTNTPVLIASRSRRGRVSESVVVNVSPTVQTLPVRLWNDPRYAQFGRPVLIAAAPGMELVPGEVVAVKFLANK
jgi:multidrug resistance efflux pump